MKHKASFPGAVRQAVRAALLLLALVPCARGADERRLVRTIPLAGLAPEDIALDTSDGSYWVTSFLDGVIYHYDKDWALLGTIPSPFFESTPLTGIACDTEHRTLLVINPASSEIVEIDTAGVPTGAWLRLELDPVVNKRGAPVVRALAYVHATPSLDPFLLVFESVGAKLYAFALDGTRIFDFVHVDDPDGYPGHGSGVGGGGIAPVFDGAGEFAGVEFTGRQDGACVIRQVRLTSMLEPVYEGRYVPLEGLTGQPAGFVRGSESDPATGAPIDVYYSAVDTQHEVFVFRTDPLPIYAPFQLTCANEASGVALAWRNAQAYDRLLLTRDGAERAVLPGDATEFFDPDLAPGEHTFSLRGARGELQTPALECRAVIGPGRVLARVELANDSPGDFALGPDGLVWLTDPDAMLVRCLAPLSWGEVLSRPVGIQSPDARPVWPMRIACDIDGRLVYLIDMVHLTLHVFDADLAPLGDPVPLALRENPDDPRYPGQLVFNPAGDGGAGSLLFVEEYQAMLYEIGRDGSILRKVRHPDWYREIPPAGSRFGPPAGGMAFAPSPGFLDITGGSLWDGWTRRILRVSLQDATPTGYEIPCTGLALYSTPTDASLLRLGNRLCVLDPYEYQGVVYEIDAPPDAPIPPTDLTSALAGGANAVAFTFRNNGPYDRLEVARDGTAAATLPGDATTCAESEVPDGMHSYAITAYAGGAPLWPLTRRLRAGPGAAAAHHVLHPIRGMESATRDPTDGALFLTSNAYDDRNKIFRFDRDGAYIAEFPSPYDGAWQVAAVAVTPAPPGRRVTTMGWHTTSNVGDRYPILLTHQDGTGAIIAGPITFSPPIMPRAPFILYPAGLNPDGAGGFWFLERNAEILWHIDAQARVLGHFPHPAPPQDQFVFGLAVALCPERATMLLSTNNPGERDLTYMLEATLDGMPTGYRLPLDGLGLGSVKAVLADGDTLYAFGFRAGMPVMITAHVFGSGPAVRNLEATLQERVPTLTWTLAGPADRVVVMRNGQELAALQPAATAFVDQHAPPKLSSTYLVRAERAGCTGPHAVCTLFVPPPESAFVRGDTNRSGADDIADAISTLAYLFARGAPPPCLDAADVDDDGDIRINDPIYLLTWLFARGPEPRRPFPSAGMDTTSDDLPCWP